MAVEFQTVCPGCGKRNELHDCISDPGDPPPKPGDFTICIKCARLLVFNLDLSLREITAPELRELMQNREKWALVERAQWYIKQRQAAS
jgi:hypothetical protein